LFLNEPDWEPLWKDIAETWEEEMADVGVSSTDCLSLTQRSDGFHTVQGPSTALTSTPAYFNIVLFSVMSRGRSRKYLLPTAPDSKAIIIVIVSGFCFPNFNFCCGFQPSPFILSSTSSAVFDAVESAWPRLALRPKEA
jgi:hypothetical protein